MALKAKYYNDYSNATQQGITMTTATMTAQDFAVFTVEMDDVGASYPAIQATRYKFNNLKEKVELCLAEPSMDLLSEEATAALANLTAPDVAIFDTEGTETTIFKLSPKVRFVAIGMPKIEHYDKELNEILPRDPKRKIGGDIVTITRVPLLMVAPDNQLVMDGDTPQIFTLKLKSSKTMLVNGDRKDKEFQSLRDIQSKVQKEFKLNRRQACLHLVSFRLNAEPHTFGNGKDSSIGVRFAIDGEYEVLPRELCMVTSGLIQDPDVMQLLKDPFNLEGTVAETESEAQPIETFEGQVEFDGEF
jgi:hypothetical protein